MFPKKEKTQKEKRRYDFVNLDAYKASYRLVIEGYNLIKMLPEYEKYNLVQQLRRSLVSIPSNIAEGYGRYNYQENIQYCRQARGSLDETRSHILIVMGLQEAPVTQCRQLLSLANKARAIINGYIRFLERSKRSY